MRPWGVALVALGLVFSTVALADFPAVNARSFQPPTDPHGSLYLEPSETPGPGAFNAAWWLVYGYRPAVLRDANGDAVSNLVSHQLSTDLLANLGIGHRFALGLDVPIVLYQHGDDNPITRGVASSTPPAFALGDLAFTGKANLVAPGSLGGFGLATLLRFSAPTGNTASYLGAGTPTGEARLLAEYRIIAIALQATGGFQFPFESSDVLGRTYGLAVPWGAALALRPQAFGWDDKGRWTWVIEAHGAAQLPPSTSAQDRGQSTPVSPAIAGLSARFAPSDVSFVAGVETGFTKALGNPVVQAMASVQWAPREHDQDHDGVPDDIDQCPELPEDRDGFEDHDGCPDWDNDDDGVGDATDRCPREKEDADGFQDDDGCPDPDNDKDGIPDAVDACPNVAGEKNGERKLNGCPDRDHDGLADKKDKCPDAPEDKDGFEDADGCPDPDNDRDGVPDAQDACPGVPHGPFPDPKFPGCPFADQDNDTYADSDDQCPADAEVWNGVQDDDGCPDAGGKPLLRVDAGGGVVLAQALLWRGTPQEPLLDPRSVPLLRALAAELLRRPNLRALFAVKPSKTPHVDSAKAEQIANPLRAYARSEARVVAAEWKAVAKVPTAASGVGILLEEVHTGAPAP